MKHRGRLTFLLLLVGCLTGVGCGQHQSKSGVAGGAEPALTSSAVDLTEETARQPSRESLNERANSNTDNTVAAVDTVKDAGDAEGDRADSAPTTVQKADAETSLRVRPRSTIRTGGVRDLTFDDLEFKIERDQKFERSMLGDTIEALDGQKVIIRGFILDASIFQLKGIKQFVLVRDNQECCFGPGAYIYHNIQIDMAEGKTTEFSIRPVTVTGELHIKPWIGPDGKCYSVFHMTAQKVK